MTTEISLLKSLYKNLNNSLHKQYIEKIFSLYKEQQRLKFIIAKKYSRNIKKKLKRNNHFENLTIKKARKHQKHIENIYKKHKINFKQIENIPYSIEADKAIGAICSLLSNCFQIACSFKKLYQEIFYEIIFDNFDHQINIHFKRQIHKGGGAGVCYFFNNKSDIYLYAPH